MAIDQSKDIFKIPVGIPVVRDPETHEMLPFIIQVRSGDIVWEDTFSGSNIESLIKKNRVENSKNVVTLLTKKYNHEGWEIESTTGDTYKARRTIQIRDFELVETNLSQEFRLDLVLPFPIRDDNSIFATLTMNSENENLSTSTLSFTTHVIANYIDFITIHIKNPVYQYHTNYKTDPSYYKSRVFIELHGNVDIPDLSHSVITGFTNLNNIDEVYYQDENPNREGMWIDPVD